MRLIHADAALIAKYNSQHESEQDKAGKLIEDAPTDNGWISTNDRMPDKSGTYLCYQPKAASICALNTVRWSEVKGWMGKEVGSRIEGIEYWMPLPEPQKEESNGNCK